MKASDSHELIDAWSDLLAASALGVEDESIGGDGIASGGPAKAKLKSNNANEDAMSVDDDMIGGWRAAVFTPRAPIGVVR